MSTKTLVSPATDMKAAAENDQRTITFYALAFSGEADLQGDIIAKTACDQWLKDFYEAGAPLPISYSHGAIRNPTDPYEIIGSAPADEEHVFADDYGLRVKAYLDVASNEKAAQVFSLVQRGVVRGASIAFDVPPNGQRRLRSGATLIEKMTISEAGPTLEPANPRAHVVSAKGSDEVRRLRAQLDSLEDKPVTKGQTQAEREEIRLVRQLADQLAGPQRPRSTAQLHAELEALDDRTPEQRKAAMVEDWKERSLQASISNRPAPPPVADQEQAGKGLQERAAQLRESEARERERYDRMIARISSPTPNKPIPAWRRAPWNRKVAS